MINPKSLQADPGSGWEPPRLALYQALLDFPPTRTYKLGKLPSRTKGLIRTVTITKFYVGSICFFVRSRILQARGTT